MGSFTEDAIIHHVAWYLEAQETPSRRSIIRDLTRDTSYPYMLEELGIQEGHEAADATFATTAWPIVQRHLSRTRGWWAMSRGRGSKFFHKSFTSPDMPQWCAYATNLRIAQREEDAVGLQEILRMTKEQCAKHSTDEYGWAFDSQYDDDGLLAHVLVHKYERNP
jgi:hypothetical protein